MNSVEPIPSPQPYTCRNCGGHYPSGAQFCPACGARVAAPRGPLETGQPRPTGPRPGPSVWGVMGAIFLALLFLPLAALGACFTLIGGATLLDGGKINGDEAWFLVIGPAGLVLAVLCLVGMVNFLRK